MNSDIACSTVLGTDLGDIRLDVWLGQYLDMTRSQAKRLIRLGHVVVDNHVVSKSGTILRPGMHIEWTLPESRLHEVDDAPELDVIYEDTALLVINKPAGVVVHPGSGVRSGTLVESIMKHIGSVSFDERAGLVHRLDKDTSGILVIAKNTAVLAALQKDWAMRRVRKTYTALLVGRLTPLLGCIDAPIKRHVRDRHKMNVDRMGKVSVTKYEVQHVLKGYTFVHLFPLTGRTHQIRVHCAAIGHPVAGDSTYGDRKMNDELKKIGLQRQFLHASMLTITHPVTGEKMTFVSPLPADLQTVLEVINTNSSVGS